MRLLEIGCWYFNTVGQISGMAVSLLKVAHFMFM